MSVMSKQIKQFFITTAMATIASFTHTANATIVQIQTSYGHIEVNLFDETTPKTVENFLSYINDNAYDDTIVHRSISGFISQSGGYYFNEEDNLLEVTEKPTVINEPVYSNVCGTIAMAKLGGDPNSATSQWFINLADNSTNLDNQNGGFTVFGQVTQSGMAVMDIIASLPTKNFGGAFTNTPVEDTSAGDTRENTVIIDSIVITDTNIDSALAVDLSTSTCSNNQINTTSSSSGTGHLGYLWISLLTLLGLTRARKH